MINKEEIEVIKVIIVGEYSTGKSAIQKRIIKDAFEPSLSQATVASSFATRLIKLQMLNKDSNAANNDHDFSRDVDSFQDYLLSKSYLEAPLRERSVPHKLSINYIDDTEPTQ